LKEEASAHTISHRDKIRAVAVRCALRQAGVAKMLQSSSSLEGFSYRSGRLPDWLKMKNPEAPAVKREAEEHWGRR
jgi:hypothetical protein